MKKTIIKNHQPLDFHWPTQEPFLFCVHHYDFYPKGNKQLSPPVETLVGRDLGMDFNLKDGFRIYHGHSVPGFPVHPHRGFETITIVRKGYADHADSMGAAGRYGEGDVQWMTAGAGVQHSEMFPLLFQDKENTLELFQIWLNLPSYNKMKPPAFKMFWSEKIPNVTLDSERVFVQLIAGEFEGLKSLSPPPDSWASDSQSETLILLVKVKPGGEFSLNGARVSVARSLYFFEGEEVEVNGEQVRTKQVLFLDSELDLRVTAGCAAVEFLILQSKPIGEPIVQQGPFVMNTKSEILATVADYRKTQFGGWPWPRVDMVHGDKIERFAKYPDGRIEKP